MPDVIFITGARGGSGATTCAVKLGEALAAQGERTLVIDGDFECASALEITGLQGLSVYTLADAEAGACRIKQAILQHPRIPNLYVLPTLGCKDETWSERAVTECGGLFDAVICDGVAARACKKAVLVCEPYRFSAGAARKKAAHIKDCGFKEAGLIVNKVNGGLVFDGAILTPQESASLIGLPLWGVVPEDLTLPLGHIKNGTKKAFCMTAKTLSGDGGKVYGVIKPYLGVKGLIKRRLRNIV